MNEERTAKLQLVLGTTCTNPNGLHVAEQTNTVVTVAGSTIVVRNFNGKKVGYILGSPNHQISCVSISPCGRYVASGEIGSNPAVRVYEIIFNKNNLQSTLLHELKHHSSEIVAVKFVPKSLYLVSVGCEQDAHVVLWNWKTGSLVASSKLSATVHALAISPDGTFFVTTGARHVKYWTIPSDNDSKTIQSRSAILADKRSSTFIDCVVVNSHRTLAVTSQGEIVEFSNKKYAKAYMFEIIKPVSIASKAEQILLGCSNGSIHCCSASDMSFVNQLPLPVPHNADPAAYTQTEHLELIPTDSKYTPVSAVQILPNGEGVVCIYEDKSFYAYVPHGSHWQKLESQLSHSSQVNALLSFANQHPYLPSDAIVTASSDFAVRIWSFDTHLSDASTFSNLISSNLIKLIKLPDEMKASTSSDDYGALSLAIAPDGSNLIAGTSVGNLHVFDLTQPDIPLLESIMAHDGAIKCMDYSSFRGFPTLFASGGTDRLVHLFRRTSQNYMHCGVIEDHEATLTSIKFSENNGVYRLYSSSQDRILIWMIVFHEDSIDFGREHVISCSSPVNDLSYWQSRNLILAGCTDWSICGYDASGKSMVSLNVPVDHRTRSEHQLITIGMDPSHTFAVVTGTNGSCYMLDLRSGSIVASLAPSAQEPVKACFSEDCKRIIIASSNGTMYAWRLATPIVNQILLGRRSMLEMAPRTPTPDSLLGSGSEALSEELHSLGLGDKLSDFGSTSSLDHSLPGPAIVLSSGNSKLLSLSVQEAQVTRRSNNNLLASNNDLSSNDIDDTQSDFISRQRNIPLYQSSKSMLNLRDGGYGGLDSLSPSVVNRQVQRKIRPSWGAGATYDPKYGQGYSENNNNLSAYKSPEHVSPPMMEYGHVRASIDSPAQPRVLPAYTRRNTEVLRSPNINPPAYSKSILNAPSSLQSPAYKASDTFGRHDNLRVSLSRKHIENAANESKSLWTSTTMTPKRTMSSLQAQTSPSGGAASAITRRPEDYSTSQLHLRSRSQSPNRFKLNQAMTPASREIAKSRRDSDMSYTAMSSRMTPASSRSNLRDSETRKSTDALNKVSALRNKMYQSSENLRKSTDNLLLASGANSPQESSSGEGRIRSMSNFRGAQLEMAGSFNPDQQTTPLRGLMNSRILARSMGNVNDVTNYGDALSARLQNTISKMKKASNPDLTNDSLYEDVNTPSPEKLRKRGAVQKRVERYHPRRNRPQTSEESDSNTSDATVRFGEGPDSQQLVKHVEECCDQFQIHVDKLICARKMVETSTIPNEQKRLIHDLMNQVSERSIEKIQNGFRSSMGESNVNDYTPSRAANKLFELKNTNF